MLILTFLLLLSMLTLLPTFVFLPDDPPETDRPPPDCAWGAGRLFDFWAPPLIDRCPPEDGFDALGALCFIFCASAEGGSSKAAVRTAVNTNSVFRDCIFM
jgi:hypothetical protein